MKTSILKITFSIVVLGSIYYSGCGYQSEKKEAIKSDSTTVCVDTTLRSKMVIDTTKKVFQIIKTK